MWACGPSPGPIRYPKQKLGSEIKNRGIFFLVINARRKMGRLAILDADEEYFSVPILVGGEQMEDLVINITK